MKWTQQELEILKNSKNNIPFIQGRSRNATRDKMVSLGLLKTNKHWTTKEISLLKKGAKIINGRTKLAIRIKKKKLGISKNPRWTKEELNLLLQNKIIKTRSAKSINEKLFQLGIKIKKQPRLKWSKNDLIKLKELHNLGKRAKDISEMKIFKMSRNAIQKKICRLGYAKKLKIFKFPKHIKHKFENFLLNNWQNKTPQDLCDIWNVENALYQTKKSRVVSYLHKLNIKIPYSEVQKINNLRKKEKILNLSNKNSIFNFDEKIKFERIKIMRTRIEKNRDLWTGLTSNENFNDD